MRGTVGRVSIMPTSDERRKVAVKLRILSDHREVDKEFLHGED